MTDENTKHEEILFKKANIFLNEKTIVHLKKFNGIFYNGRLFEVDSMSLKIHDRMDGIKKVFFVEIKSLDEYEIEDDSN